VKLRSKPTTTLEANSLWWWGGGVISVGQLLEAQNFFDP